MLALALTLAVVAPLPFGGTLPASRGAFAIALAAGLAILWRQRRALSLPDGRLALLVLATAAVALLYLVPLPPVVVETVSPRLAEAARASLAFPGEPEEHAAAERQLAALAGLARPEPGWRTLSADPDGTLDGVTRLLLALGAFVLALLATRTHRERRWIAAAILVSACLQAAYGLVETFSGHQHILHRPKTYFASLPTGTFVNPNHFAALLSLGLFAALGLASRGRAPADDEAANEPRRSSRIARLAVVALVLVVAMIWSSSRAALASAAAGLFVFGVWIALRDRRAGSGAAWRLAAPLGLAALLVAMALWVRPPAPLLDEVERVPAGVASRVDVWKTALSIAARYSLAGTGPGTFSRVYDVHRAPEFATRVSHAHSDYLEWVAETGALGAVLLLLWGAGLFASARAVTRGKRGRELTGALAAALAALAVHEGVDFSLQLPGVALPAALVLGAFLAPTGWGPARVPRLASRGRWWPVTLALLFAALVLTGGLTLARLATPSDSERPPSLARSYLSSAETLRRYGRDQVQRALAVAPDGTRPSDAERIRRAGAAVVALQRAAQRAPLRGEIRLTSSLAAAALAQLAGAAESAELNRLARYYLQRAEQLAPSSRARRLALARHWVVAGDATEARRVVRELIDMDESRAGEAYELLGGASLALEDLMEATPNRPGPALALARYLIDERKDDASALVVLEKSLARHPRETASRQTLAATLARSGRHDDALAVLDASPAPAATASERMREQRLRARLYGKLGRLDEEQGAIDELERLGEDGRIVALYRARSWMGTAREDEAVVLLRTIVTGPSRRLPVARKLEAALLLGGALDRRGDLRGALEAYRVAAGIDPGHPRVREFRRTLEMANPAAAPEG